MMMHVVDAPSFALLGLFVAAERTLCTYALETDAAAAAGQSSSMADAALLLLRLFLQGVRVCMQQC